MVVGCSFFLIVWRVFVYTVNVKWIRNDDDYLKMGPSRRNQKKKKKMSV